MVVYGPLLMMGQMRDNENQGPKRKGQDLLLGI